MSAAVNAPFLTSSVRSSSCASARAARPGSATPRALERRHGRGEQLERVARRQLDPARDREQAAGLQVLAGSPAAPRPCRGSSPTARTGRPRTRRTNRAAPPGSGRSVAVLAATKPRASATCTRTPGALYGRPEKRARTGARTRSTTCGFSSTASIARGAVIERLQHVGAGARAQHQHARLRAAGGRAAPRSSGRDTRAARAGRRSGSARSALRRR